MLSLDNALNLMNLILRDAKSCVNKFVFARRSLYSTSEYTFYIFISSQYFNIFIYFPFYSIFLLSLLLLLLLLFLFPFPFLFSFKFKNLQSSFIEKFENSFHIPAEHPQNKIRLRRINTHSTDISNASINPPFRPRCRLR